MKVIMASLILAGSLSIGLSSPASAAYCVARSGTGAYGWARNYSPATAKYNALVQCAVRTPRGIMCYITTCSY